MNHKPVEDPNPQGLLRLVATRKFFANGRLVPAGTRGGLVAPSVHVDQSAWVDEESTVTEAASINGSAWVVGSHVSGYARIGGHATVHGSVVTDEAYVWDRAHVSYSILEGDISIHSTTGSIRRSQLRDTRVHGDVIINTSRMGRVVLTAGKFVDAEIAHDEQILQVRTPQWGILSMAPSVRPGNPPVFTVGCQTRYGLEQLHELKDDYFEEEGFEGQDFIRATWDHFEAMAQAVSQRFPWVAVPDPSPEVMVRMMKLKDRLEELARR